MFCRKCGVEQAEGTKFCPACAHPVNGVIVKGASLEKTALTAIFAVVGVFVLIVVIGIVAAIVLPKMANRRPPAAVTRVARHSAPSEPASQRGYPLDCSRCMTSPRAPSRAT
jgi:uncharacterized membrane protein YvbJ